MPEKASDLARMRLLLQSQRTPTVQLAPVQDIGGGISQAANNIAQFMMQHQQQRQLADMLAQEEKAQQEAALQQAATDQAGANSLGVDLNTFRSLTDAQKNTMTGENMKRAELGRNADQVQQFGGILPGSDQYGYMPVPVNAPGFANLDPNGFVIDRNTANIMAGQPDAMKKLALSKANPQALKALSPLLDSQDMGTVQGVNNAGILTDGLMSGAPTDTYSLDQKYQNARGQGLQNNLLFRRAPLQLAQDYATIGNTMAGTANTQANTAHTNLTNQAYPALTNLQLHLGGQTGDLNDLNIGRQNGQLGLMSNLLNDPSLLADPNRAPLTTALGQYYSGTGNPVQAGLGAINTIANPKPGKSLSKPMTDMGKTYPKNPGAKPGLAALQAGMSQPAKQKPAPSPAPAPSQAPFGGGQVLRARNGSVQQQQAAMLHQDAVNNFRNFIFGGGSIMDRLTGH